MSTAAHRAWGALVVSLLALLLAPTARAFDTGPHFDITRDALTAEGFSDRSLQYVQVSNWLTDLYENAEKIPFSGHSDRVTYFLGGGLGHVGKWADEVVSSADRSHFDGTDGGFSNSTMLTNEWDRLRRNAGALAREARDQNRPELLLTVLGITSHQVQDFYSHTNWLEPDGVPGRDGPGWAARGFGATPTWFDIPAPVRGAEVLYSGGSIGVARDHGGWKADGNRGLTRSNAKDWPGRPLYTEAHVAAYFATRQWVQGLRAHVADDAFWARAMALRSQPFALARDQKGALNISVATGHWQGQGEPCNPSFATLSCGDRNGPGGSLLDARGALKDYFSHTPASLATQNFERTVPRLNCPNPKFPAIACPGTGAPVFDLPPSRPMQASNTFVRLEITSMKEIDNLDIPGAADMFVRARIGAQRYISGVINDRDTFSFRRPHAPYTFLKSVPNGAVFDRPVTSIRVRIRTGTLSGSGTDDTVYLRINDRQRFALDKRLYDDFERGDDDTYSVPIDAALRDGLRVSDIKYLQIEKSRDGRNGAWRLASTRVWVNERLVLAATANRWLQGSRRTWRAPGFVASNPVGPAMPVFMQLWEMDAPLRGDHDHTDIFPWDRRKDLTVTYASGSGTRTGTAAGASRYGGRLGDGERARLTWRLSTYTPTPAEPVVIPPPAPLPPDLVVTAFDFTRVIVKNNGPGPAGPSKVSIDFIGTRDVPALAPGEEYAVPASQFAAAGTYTATADPQGLIAETNETNNTFTIMVIT